MNAHTIEKVEKTEKTEKIYLSEPAVVSAAGIGIEELWRAVTTGDNSAMKRVEACGKDFWAAKIDDSLLKSSEGRFDMRIIKIENVALAQIAPLVEKAKLMYGANRIAVLVGSCDNGSEFSLKAHRNYFASGSFPADYTLEMQGADYVASFVAEKFDLSGITLAFSTACSSSATALIKASELICAGLCDVAIAGGVDIVSDTTLLGFGSLGAISSEKTNPFSANRSGITLGDGAAFFVVSKERLSDKAIELAGFGESADAYHATSPDPSGSGAMKAMRAALKMANIEANKIGYVNLHGTGTKLNDSMEAKAVCEVVGKEVLCSSTKSETGHTLGAAAAIEAAVCFKVLTEKTEKMPLQVWDGERDTELENIIDTNRSFSDNAINKIEYCMSNSFAFGGANVSLIFKRV